MGLGLPLRAAVLGLNLPFPITFDSSPAPYSGDNVFTHYQQAYGK